MDKMKHKIFAVAPMMDWTDRLYTEMVTADPILRSDRERLIDRSTSDFDPIPAAAQCTLFLCEGHPCPA